MPQALYMVVEHFKNGDAVAVYRRFREKGRMAPEGCKRCYHLMETDDRQLLDSCTANWSDLIDFEVFSVMTSQEAIERITAQL